MLLTIPDVSIKTINPVKTIKLRRVNYENFSLPDDECSVDHLDIASGHKGHHGTRPRAGGIAEL
jgi:hypothetical protein